MKDRLRNIRLALNLSQDEFGKKIGIQSRAHISALESGTRNITERIVNDVCDKYNVSENWLRTGEGKMFIEVPEEDLYSKAAATLLKEDDALAIEGLKLYWSLSPELKRAAEDHILMLADMIRKHRNKTE